MAPCTHVDVTGCTTRCAVTHGTEAVEFVDLLVADDEWLRREFDAIVAAGWGGVEPPCPAPKQGAHWPRRHGADNRPTSDHHHLCGLRPGFSAPVHQRGPPQ